MTGGNVMHHRVGITVRIYGKKRLVCVVNDHTTTVAAANPLRCRLPMRTVIVILTQLDSKMAIVDPMPLSRRAFASS